MAHKHKIPYRLSWTAINSGLTDNVVFALTVSGENLFAGTHRGVCLSTNNGTSWIQTGLTNTVVNALTVSGTNLFAGTQVGVFLSTNNGTSWTAVNTGLTSSNVSALAVYGTNLFAGTYGDGVFLSTNNGTSWTAAHTPFSGFSQMIQLGPNLFAGTGNGVFLSTNSGTSWTAINSGLTDTFVRALAVFGGSLFAGTGAGGVFLTTNSGTIWTGVNTGLTNTNVGALAVSEGNLYAGTDGSGVWICPLSEMITDVESDQPLPVQFTLDQNYPNPFNPSTTIKYELPNFSIVRLSVYDMLGREVSVLVNERREAGCHEVRFDASGLSSGVYFYRLQARLHQSTPGGGQAEDFVQTRKLLFLR